MTRALYFGTRLTDASLTPGPDAHLGTNLRRLARQPPVAPGRPQQPSLDPITGRTATMLIVAEGTIHQPVGDQSRRAAAAWLGPMTDAGIFHGGWIDERGNRLWVVLSAADLDEAAVGPRSCACSRSTRPRAALSSSSRPGCSRDAVAAWPLPVPAGSRVQAESTIRHQNPGRIPRLRRVREEPVVEVSDPIPKCRPLGVGRRGQEINMAGRPVKGCLRR